MLDIALRGVSFAYRKSSFAIRDVTIDFQKSTHTAIIGPSGAGASTLLSLIAGTIQPATGDVVFGTRRVNGVRASARPLLYVTSQLNVTRWWSVRHALVAAVRQRTLDRIDRQREFDLAAEKWSLAAHLDRRVGTLSGTEKTLVHLARIELLRPGILVADRILELCNPAETSRLADELYRTLRVMGATVISVPSSFAEHGHTDSIVVLRNGSVVQRGPAAQIYASPVDEVAAAAIGDVTIVPIEIRGSTVESVIGFWELSRPPFQGTGLAIARPGDFQLAARGEESDLIASVEEASFAGGLWHITAMLSGSVKLRIALPGNAPVHKGKLVALRYDPSRFTLLPREMRLPQASVPTDVLPPMRESR